MSHSTMNELLASARDRGYTITASNDGTRVVTADDGKTASLRFDAGGRLRYSALDGHGDFEKPRRPIDRVRAWLAADER